MPESIALPLLDEIRALYEGRVMPVREIAQRAGITERALYKHVRDGGWQRRNAFAGRDTMDDGLADAGATAAADVERERWAKVIDHACGDSGRGRAGDGRGRAARYAAGAAGAGRARQHRRRGADDYRARDQAAGRITARRMSHATAAGRNPVWLAKC